MWSFDLPCQAKILPPTRGISTAGRSTVQLKTLLLVHPLPQTGLILSFVGLTHQVRNVGAIHELPLREIKAFSALKA